MLEFSLAYRNIQPELIELFRRTFSESENAEEGELIANLVKELLHLTNDEDKFVVSAHNDETLIGCIIFSRLTFAGDERTVFMLSPVAIDTAMQKQGLGQLLIKHGLETIQQSGVDIAVTYGDPTFYHKVGFQQVTEELVPPPMKLNYPEGWQAQSLTDEPLSQLIGTSQCVTPFNKANLW